MTEPERFIKSKGLKAQLLASAKSDRPPDGSRRRALVAAGAVLAASTKASFATATLGSLARVAVWKWIAVGAVSVGTVVAAKSVIVHSAPTVEASRTQEARSQSSRPRQAPTPVAAPAPPSVPAEPPPIPAEPPSSQPAPAAIPTDRTSLLLPAAARRAEGLPAPKPHGAVPAPQAAAEPVPHASSEPPSSGSRLASEITAIDQMKRALAASDAAETLRLVDAYRASFPTGTLAAEATALRVEALARAGRRDEARAELARLRVAHPESPLLENLGQIVEE